MELNVAPGETVIPELIKPEVELLPFAFSHPLEVLTLAV
jgi:hypothetical protein